MHDYTNHNLMQNSELLNCFHFTHINVLEDVRIWSCKKTCPYEKGYIAKISIKKLRILFPILIAPTNSNYKCFEEGIILDAGHYKYCISKNYKF